ncbi:MAG: excinuclease ABC subunit UvrC [Nitrospirae bacterium]|nr:excinuclease ABC subunit UvrC [Nitrospirota bacterium]
MEVQADLSEKLRTVPEKPGVYMFKDGKERILYVGKARNLRNRLKSYFQQSANLDPRKAAMIRRVRDFAFVVTETEVEALALEANLIKQHKPRYNVILRDDKNYPYLKLTIKEEWPRLEVVRRITKDGSLYFGPYIPASSVRETLAFVRRHFNIRPCRYRLDRPMRPCVQYQMGRCPAPCAGLVSRTEYLKAVREVERFLRGEKKELLEDLEARMQKHAEELRFEEAAKIRDRLQALRGAFESQKVVSPELGDIDVIGFYREGVDAVFQVFFIRNGILISAKDFHIKDTEFIPGEELFEKFITLFYAKEIIPPDEILVQVRPAGIEGLRKWLSEKRGGRVRIRLPERGKKKDLVGMASENARLVMLARKGAATREVMKRLRHRFGLRKTPGSIGAFDVSTIFGSHSVGGFVWWEDGEFRKELYRRLKIRDVSGMDDYSMMREIIVRTVRNLDGNLPDLVLIDGGKGHLEAALSALSELTGREVREVDVVAIAKGPDRVFLPDGTSVLIEDGSPDSLLLRRIRDEVHRFAISFHRRLRGKGLLESRLENIAGIGKKRRLALLRRFGSVEAIKRASVEEVAAVEGMNRKVAEKLLSEL